MKAFNWLCLFLGACILFIFFNEVIILPYQVWDPSGLISREAMASRDPMINLGLVMGSFLIICLGSFSYVSYYELVRVIDHKRSLADLPIMRGTTKRGSG